MEISPIVGSKNVDIRNPLFEGIRRHTSIFRSFKAMAVSSVIFWNPPILPLLKIPTEAMPTFTLIPTEEFHRNF